MRYAVYFLCQPQSDLAAFASEWLGYDVERGEVLSQTRHPATPHNWISDPKRYGFHATIKAPFHLTSTRSPEDLLSSLSGVCAAERAIDLGPIQLRQIRDFLALVPETSHEALPALVQRCVEALDDLRAPLTPADRERRMGAQLSSREIELMDRWGYPYVCELYRFHMTLTNSLPQQDLTAASRILEDRLKGISLNQQLDSLSLCVQPTASEPFRLLRRFPLSAA